MVELDDPVQVGVFFEEVKVHPVWFRWRGRKIQIQRVTMHWHSTQGRVSLSHFAVSNGLNLYELTLNHQDLTWRLTRADG